MLLMLLSPFAAFILVAICTFVLYSRYSYKKIGCINYEDGVKGKIVVITGTSSGIGKCLARQLTHRGATVVGGCRSISIEKLNPTNKCEEEEEAHFEQFFLDLSSFESVLKFYELVSLKYGKVDILINNAAYMGPKRKSSNGCDYSFQVNYLSHFLLTLLIVGRHLQTGDRKKRLLVVNLTSDIVHRARSLRNDDVTPLTNRDETSIVTSYANTKVCMILFSDELHRRLHTSGISAVSIHPGRVHSDLQKHWPGIKGTILRFASAFFLYPTEVASNNIFQLCVCPEVDRFSGEVFIEKEPVRSSLICPQRCRRIAKNLWELSMKMIQTEGFLQMIFSKASKDFEFFSQLYVDD